MSAVPVIPPAVATLAQLDDWISANAARPDGAANQSLRFAERLRMAVAVMDRASEIGRLQRGEQP